MHFFSFLYRVLLYASNIKIFLEFLVAKFTCVDECLEMLVDAAFLPFLIGWRAVWTPCRVWEVIAASSHYAVFT